MTEATQAPNEQATPPVPQAKMVPERDLLAIKSRAEEEIKGLKDKLTASEEAHQQAHNKYLQTLAAKEQLEQEYKDGYITKSEYEKVKTELESHKTTVVSLETKLADQKKGAAISLGYPKASLEGKTSEQLDLILETLQAAGLKKLPSMDLNGGSAASTVSQTPIDKCRDEIIALRARQGKN